MKKIIILLIIIIPLVTYSQKSHLGLNMGPTFPLKTYALADVYESDGYANPGFNLSFEGNYVPTWYFGIGGEITFSTNYPDQDSMMNALLKEIETNSQIQTIPDYAKINYSVDNWSYVNILVGPTFSYPAGVLQINLKALVGLSVIMPPNQYLEISYDKVGITSSAGGQNARFCYNLGTDIIVKLNRNYSLIMGAEYFHTKTSYDVEVVLNNDTPLPSIPREINIDALHTTLGLAMLF